jgi:hypothetical protein
VGSESRMMGRWVQEFSYRFVFLYIFFFPSSRWSCVTWPAGVPPFFLWPAQPFVSTLELILFGKRDIWISIIEAKI